MIDVGESNGFQPVSVVSTCPSGMSLLVRRTGQQRWVEWVERSG